MSPQSRAAATAHTTLSSRDDGFTGNPCPGTSSVAEIARAADMEYALHKIESESSATTASSLLHPANGANTPQQSRKRPSARISSSPKNEPFLSSYGSAFLSGIFADINQAPSDEPSKDGADPAASAHAGGGEPRHKKARNAATTSFGRQPKSIVALSVLADGAVSEVSSPSVVSPRPNESTLNIQRFNDQVRELQDMAFPSLPQIPNLVSSSSSATLRQPAVSPRVPSAGENDADQDSPSYGWFVSTDDDEATDDTDQNEPSAPTFLPDTKPDLTFKTITASDTGDDDIEVQQALAADTIDDVLGDLF
ncbi:hypothetical protein ACHAWF_017684 [Thalassiosira exigua]